MRLHIQFQLDKQSAIPIDHYHALTGLVYRLLGTSDSDYAGFLHEEGYAEQSGAAKKSKLFSFSGLRAPASSRRIERDMLILAPGPVDWYLSSPRDDFLLHSATGLLAEGAAVEICAASLRIEMVEALAEPEFAQTTEFRCLTPIIVSEPRPDGTTNYLRPGDPNLSELVRTNLLWKHRLIHGNEPEDDRLSLEFSPRYLADPKNRGGTRLVCFKGISMVGAFAPLRLTGSTELMKTAYECGLGGKNSIGMGTIEVVNPHCPSPSGRG